MDDDSSTKFIESLTKFLQSLCNGYVEFQRGVELVGHIYLSVDTGEKVDYILHEKVSKNDENSVTFVSNSFHALPKEKDKSKAPANAGISKTLGPKGSSDDDDDDDIVIVDQPDNVLGSTNSGTLPYRGLKRVSSASSDHRRPGVSLHRSPSSGSSYQSSPWRNRQPSGPAATAPSQENISIGEVKLEQISSDELLTLASQVDDGASSSQGQGRPGGGGQSDHGSFSSNDAPGQAWIKQEPMDETQRGLDTGWSQSDSSNSGSNLYPVMMHQNSAAFTSSPVIPGFSSSSGLSGTLSSRHGLGQSLPGTPGGSNPYGSPMPGTSQNTSGMDPSDLTALALVENEDLQKVCEAVMRIRSRELTLRKAADLYGIPRSTLSDRVVGRVRLLARRVKRRHHQVSETVKRQRQSEEQKMVETCTCTDVEDG